MLLLSTLAVISFRGYLVQARSILPEAVKHAVASSFSETADILHIVIETDFDDNVEAFFDTIDYILLEDWTFRFQIDVNNRDGQAVSDHNLWLIDSYEGFRRLLPWIRDYHKDSQMFYFIVLRNSKVEEYLNEIQKIFSDFLELMIGNVNIITETASGEVLFYTFYPFQELTCRSTKPFITQRFTNNSINTVMPFFPPKADNFHKCPLRIRTRNYLILTTLGEFEQSYQLANYEMSILELIILKEFALRMNFTYDINNVTVSARASRLTEPHELMALYGSDLIIGFYKNDHLENRYLSKSVSYDQSWLVICLRPQPNTLRTHAWLLVGFDATTWIYTVFSFVLVTGCLFLAKKSKLFSSIFGAQFHRSGGLEVLSVAIGAPVGPLPSKNSLRFCFIVVSIGALILRAAYQGKLFDAYRERTILKSPNSVRELFNENYTVYTHTYYRSVINDLNGMEYPFFEDLEGVAVLREVLSTDEKLAVVASYAHIYTFYTTQEHKQLIVKPVLIEQICMFFKQHSVIQPRINEIIMRMEEAGILRHLRKNYENLNDAGFYQDEKDNEDEPRPLVFERFAFTFYLWGVLCAISCIVFVGEILWHKLK